MLCEPIKEDGPADRVGVSRQDPPEIATLRKNNCMFAANASVVTARNRPGIRRAESPRDREQRARKTCSGERGDGVRAVVRGQPSSDGGADPASAHWPKLICPAHPVRMTRETPTRL